MLHELSEIILAGDTGTLAFVEQLGLAYDSTTSTPLSWVGRVVEHGVSVGATLPLLRFLIEKDFKDRAVSYDPNKVLPLIDCAYKEEKEKYDRYPAYYIKLHSGLK